MSKYTTINISWNELSCSVPSKVDSSTTLEILKDVSGYASAGQVTSIMGPSGAGKTTMMDLLAGRLEGVSEMDIQGEVLVNNQPIDYKRFRRSTGYVTQHDYLPITETVRECLMFSAQLRLPSDVTKEQRRKRVDNILDELGLVSCADTYIGDPSAGIKGVSGGEKRRVSVGVELITAPTCLFLDEPTSGLDSEIAVSIMRTLKNIAAAGRTVALTIHQPNSDITELFDNFLLMGKGQVLYAGPWLESVDAFAEAGFPCPRFKNPTDYYLAVASDPENIPGLVQKQKRRFVSSQRHSFKGENGAQAPSSGAAVGGTDDVPLKIHSQAHVSTKDLADAVHDVASPTSALAQMWCLCQRFMRAWKRHPIMLMGEGVQYVFMGAFIGGMYYGVSDSVETGVFDRGAAGFFILVTVLFTPPFTAITVWQQERSLVRREVEQNIYSLSVFFWAKTFVMLPVEVFFSFVVSILSYFMFGFQNDAGKFLIFTMVLAVSLLIAESFGMLFAMTFKTADIAIVLFSIIFIILLSLTGFLTSSMPVYYEWIQYISFMRYANSAVFLNEMNGLVLKDENGEGVRGETLTDGVGLDNDLSVGANIAVLFAMLVIIRTLAFLGLKLSWKLRWL